MKKSILVLSVIAIVLVAVCVVLLVIPRSMDEFQRFNETYNLTLPQDTELIFSEDTHGALLNDGELLYVFQLTNDGMKTFLEQSGIKRFGKLPLSAEFRIQLHKKIIGPAEQGAKLMINATNEKAGYYTFENRHGTPFELSSSNNWLSCIVSTDKNRIYFYTYDS